MMFGALIVATFYWLNRVGERDGGGGGREGWKGRARTPRPRLPPPSLAVVPKVAAGQPKKKKEKVAMGVGESVQFLAKSPYIRDLATLVVAYGERGGGEEEETDARQSQTQPQPPPRPCRHLHQPRGSHVEVQDQGPVPQPQRLLGLHGRLLDRDR